MIKIEKLTKIYGKRAIFSDFSFDFPDRGLVCLIGSSGSGKSTLLNIISGVDNEYKGCVEINGTKLNKLTLQKASDYRIENIGYVFQNFNLLNLDTVFNNVLLPLETTHYAKRAILKKRVHDALDIVGLKNYEKQRVNKLSGGEKQRVAIARAIINNPKVVLCDEPTGALDEKNGQAIFNLLKSISKKTLVVVATHDFDSIKNIADCILEIKNGSVKIEHFKGEDNKTGSLSLIGKGNKRSKPRVSLLFKIEYAFQKIKAKKIRSLILNLMLSLSLTGIGLSLIITNSVSSKIEQSFQALLNGNFVIISNKNENDNSFTTTYASSFNNVSNIYNRYQYLLEGVGVNYLVNFEDFFKDNDQFYIESLTKKIRFDSLNSRSINDFRWVDENEGRIYYPYDVEEMDDDHVILGLSYEDMMNLCFSLSIQRSYSSLGHFIHEKGLTLSLDVRNDYWQYDDEQLLTIDAVCESSSTCIYHTNYLWNQVVFEEMMRLPSDDDEYHEFPWEMYKIFYFKTKEDPAVFLNASLYDESLYDYVFERTNSSYNPQLCKGDDVCKEKRVYVYSVDKNTIQTSLINEYKDLNKSSNYYFTSDFGYSSYASNVFSGFSKNVFISSSEELIDDAIDADTQLNDSSGLALNLPRGIVQGNYLISLGDGLRFSTNISKLIKGRKPTNINEIVVSKGLAESLFVDGQFLGKYVEIAGEIEEFYRSDTQIEKTYNKTKLLVVGVVDEDKNYIYQNENWTIEFFRDKLGVSSFNLIPKSIVFEFDNQEDAKVGFKDLQQVFSGYKIESPIEELKTNIDTTLDYANTILKVFSILAAVISILLLGTTMMLNIIESKNDIKLLSLLGIRSNEINSIFIVQSVVQGFISFVVSSIELVIVDILMSYLLGDMLGIGFHFTFNSIPILVVFLIAIFVPMIVSFVLIFFLGRKHLVRTK